MNMTIDGTDFGDLWIWPDEYDWSPVVQNTEHTVTGALVPAATWRRLRRCATQAAPTRSATGAHR